MLRRVFIFLGLLTVGLLSAEVRAQSAPASSDPDLRLEAERKRFIVHPKPNPEVATQDAEQVAAELARRRREDALIRDATRPLSRRPDLDYDVRSGIQELNLRRVLPR